MPKFSEEINKLSGSIEISIIAMMEQCMKVISPVSKDVLPSILQAKEQMKRKARAMLGSYGLTDSEMEYFSYYFDIIRNFPLPPEPKSPPPEILVRTSATKPTLVMDLDETMVHADDAFDLELTEYSTHFTLRPGLRRFLAEISPLYEIIVFTASTPKHADPLLEAIDPDHKFFKCVLYRSSCVPIKGYFVKDLRVIGKVRDLENVLLVDDSLISMAFNLENGISISSYNGDKEDGELLLLEKYLKTLSASGQKVRTFNSHTFKLGLLKKLFDILHN